jgi:hypothetical protein
MFFVDGSGPMWSNRKLATCRSVGLVHRWKSVRVSEFRLTRPERQWYE